MLVFCMESYIQEGTPLQRKSRSDSTFLIIRCHRRCRRHMWSTCRRLLSCAFLQKCVSQGGIRENKLKTIFSWSGAEKSNDLVFVSEHTEKRQAVFRSTFLEIAACHSARNRSTRTKKVTGVSPSLASADPAKRSWADPLVSCSGDWSLPPLSCGCSKGRGLPLGPACNTGRKIFTSPVCSAENKCDKAKGQLLFQCQINKFQSASSWSCMKSISCGDQSVRRIQYSSKKNK